MYADKIFLLVNVLVTARISRAEQFWPRDIRGYCHAIERQLNYHSSYSITSDCDKLRTYLG